MRCCSLCKKTASMGSRSLFHVPKDIKKRIQWSEICGKIFVATSFVCSDHFLPANIARTGNTMRLLPFAEPVMKQCKVENTSENSSNKSNCLDQINEHSIIESRLLMEPWYNDPRSSTPIEECNKKQENIRFKDQDSQTDPISSINCQNYCRRNLKLETENKELRLELEQANKVIGELRKIFTEGQVRKMMFPGAVKWKSEDISSAICLHASGPRAYNHLYKKGFPLPHKSSLQRWCAKITLNEGILSNSIEFMRQTTELKPEDKICVLAFDEMKVAETFEYDPVGDVVKKPAKFVQLVMARGLRNSWKQPVFYDFDCRMTKELLSDIICQLNNAGFPVVAIVCDMGSSNRKLWSDLGITSDKPWFSSPACKDDKVFCFADAPHLLKLIRNHFLDTGLVFNKSILTSRTIIDLLKLTSKSDLSITFKLSEEQIFVKGPGRQKVKLAAQLFSNTVANAIRRCYSLGMDLYEPTESADFFQLVNDWFDIHNSKLNNFKIPGKEPYGIALESQNKILNKMTEIMSSPIIPGRKTTEVFQKGIIISNNSLVMLREYVERYNMKYLVTYRLNQDVLEHFFGAIRSKGGLNDHPSPRDFKYRLRKYIIAKNTELLNGTGNVELDTTDWLNASSSDEIPKSQNITELDIVDDNIVEGLPEEGEFVDIDESCLDDIGILQDDALEYISGYIIKKLKLEEYECHENYFSWIDQISNNLLKKPKESFLCEMKKLEMVFNKLNGNDISYCRKLKQNLLENSITVDLPDNIKNFFYKCRIYFRVKQLNQKLKIKKSKQRLMGFSKMIKIKL